MKKARALSVISLVALCCTQYTFSRELRLPVMVFRGQKHFPYPLPREEDNSPAVDVWSSSYFRTANKAFIDDHSAQTEALGALFCGKADFQGQQAFACSTINTPGNPWLVLSTMSPRVIYTERGIFFGATVDVQYDKKTRIGLRGRLPFASIETRRFTNCDSTSDELGPEMLEEVASFRQEEFGTTQQNTKRVVDFAYRLDFLSLLDMDIADGKKVTPFIKYANADVMNHITIANQDATDLSVHLIKQQRGNKPDGRFGELQQNGGVPLSSDGTRDAITNRRIQDNERAHFDSDTNYTLLSKDRCTQATLWIVPGMEVCAQTPEAMVLRETVDNILDFLDDSAEDFFSRHDVCFKTQKLSGIGDLDIEGFIDHQFNDTTAGQAFFHHASANGYNR